MIKQETLALCAADLGDKLIQWDTYLRVEKNVSPHTLRAYSADVGHFVDFLFNHLATAPCLNDLSNVTIRDFRSWMSKHIKRQSRALPFRCEEPANVAG